MGILDFLGGLGKSGGAGGMERLTSGLGQQGGLLQKFGMGQFGGQPMGGGGLGSLGQPGGLIEMFQRLQQPQGGAQDAAGGPGPPSPQPTPGMPQGGLLAAIQRFLQQQGR